jgi:hypothetical protein
MNLNRARRIHRFISPLAPAIVALFLATTVGVELWGDHSLIAWQKRVVLIGLVPLAIVLATTAATGQAMARRYRPSPELAAKRRRMPFILANGLLVLVPAAVTLDWLAQQGAFGPPFAAVQALELAAGATNLTLLLLMARDGRAMARRRRPGPAHAARRPAPAGSDAAQPEDA